MKKDIVFIFGFLVLLSQIVFAQDISLIKEREIQEKISACGVDILNKNHIQKKIVFLYNKEEYKKTPVDPALSKRQVVFWDEYFKYISMEDELAGFLSMEISQALKSYSGQFGGFVSTLQAKAAPKKYELFFDKQAVDFMVKAGYNPLGLITFINKSESDGLMNKFFHNSTTKRQAVIYEYIYYNYPQFLKHNNYLNNPDYQNFLITSIDNREKLYEKIKTNSNKEIKYE